MHDLRSIITPELLERMVAARFPWPATERISHRTVLDEFFGTDEHFARAARAIAWPALKAVSAVGPHAVPDLTGCLPVPADAAYPRRALGLHVLLDQAPRVLFRGVDARWTAYFDRVVAALFDAQRRELPPSLWPWARGRWEGVEGQGASFEYWVVVHWTWNSALTHRESVARQEEALASKQLLEFIRAPYNHISSMRDKEST